MTTIYLIRHSKSMRAKNDLNTDSLQIQNEKQILSIDGEEIAKEKMDSKEFENIDILYSSNYVRTMQTAKYLANKFNLEINVVSDLGERKYGIKSWDEFPEDFEIRQLEDEEYKIGDGENQREVRERMYKAIMNILTNNKNKRIAIVSHSTAITFLLKKWCDISADGNVSFDGNTLFDGKWDYCETFKLEFDDNNNLINIKNIKFI